MGILEHGGKAGECLRGPVKTEEWGWGGVWRGCGGGGRVVYRLSSERMMEWSDRTELWRPTWKLRTNGHRDGETMP